MVRPSRSMVEVVGVVALWTVVIGVVAFLWLRGRFFATQIPSSGRATTSTTDSAMSMAAPPPVDTDGEAPRGAITIDPQRQQLLGVRLAPAVREALSADIRTTGTVRYDETRQTDINVKLDGWIRQLHVDYTGQSVTVGQPLFTLYSPDLLAAQREYLLALRTRDGVHASTIADARTFAAQVVDASRQKLALWDFTAEDIAQIERTGEAREAVTVASPGTGVVVEKSAVQGMHVTAGQTLYRLADLSTVWIEADVYEQDIRGVRVGQRAMVTLDAYPGETFQARAIYVLPFIEEKTRTAKVRFQLSNARGRLRPGMYAAVELRGAATAVLTVPANAVLDSGTQRIVFVSSDGGTFTPRTVSTGRRTAERVEILDGLKEGEQVATSATFFLDSESQLRAGLQNYESPMPMSAPAAAAGGLDITFRSQPDPPRTGESTFEVTVKDGSNAAITDAEVRVQQFMPAMPTMNMPAMRTEAVLSHAGGGLYRGPAQVMMAGRWDVTVTVTRAGQTIGRKQFAVVAK